MFIYLNIYIYTFSKIAVQLQDNEKKNNFYSIFLPIKEISEDWKWSHPKNISWLKLKWENTYFKTLIVFIL